MRPAGSRPPGELLQTSTTIAAVAIALATLTAEDESLLVDWLPVDILLLLGGLSSLAGSLFAMVALWEEAGLTPLDLVPLPNPHREELSDHDQALRFTTYGMLLLGVAYGAIAVGLL